MNDREKLVELLKTNACPSPFMCDPTCRYYGYGDCFPDRFADHLLANGVTISEQGEWETDKEDIEWGNALKRKHCSKCGKRPHFDKEKREFVLSDFCPHCGAPMKGETK